VAEEFPLPVGDDCEDDANDDWEVSPERFWTSGGIFEEEAEDSCGDNDDDDDDEEAVGGFIDSSPKV